MVNRPKMQGTAFETWLVNSLDAAALWLDARRIAEGGKNDRGDIEFEDVFHTTWVIEAKATQTLNVTRALGKARKKGGDHTVLAWKRLVKKTGKNRRVPDGEPIVVVMAWDTFVELMSIEDVA